MFNFIKDCTIGAKQTYQKMLGDKPIVIGPTETISGIINVREVTAIIGFTGELIGSMLISMSEESAKKSISQFMGFEINEINDDVLDGVEEIVNIISGVAASRFPKKTGLGLPTVLVGERQRIHARENSPWILTTMQTEQLGQFTIGATLKEV